jgi:hypothetical protein
MGQKKGSLSAEFNRVVSGVLMHEEAARVGLKTKDLRT